MLEWRTGSETKKTAPSNSVHIRLRWFLALTYDDSSVSCHLSQCSLMPSNVVFSRVSASRRPGSMPADTRDRVCVARESTRRRDGNFNCGEMHRESPRIPRSARSFSPPPAASKVKVVLARTGGGTTCTGPPHRRGASSLLARRSLPRCEFAARINFADTRVQLYFNDQPRFQKIQGESPRHGRGFLNNENLRFSIEKSSDFWSNLGLI